jgi:DNA-binding MarR family transcriptional regulator
VPAPQHPVFEVRDERRVPRHGIVWADDWDTPRFRLLTMAQRVVYVTLTVYAAGGRGDVWPKQATIAQTTGLTLRAVEKAIDRLAQLGYVRVTRQPTGLRRRNVYTLLSPPQEIPT